MHAELKYCSLKALESLKLMVTQNDSQRGFGHALSSYRDTGIIWDSEQTYLGTHISTLISAIEEGVI